MGQDSQMGQERMRWMLLPLLLVGLPSRVTKPPPCEIFKIAEGSDSTHFQVSCKGNVQQVLIITGHDSTLWKNETTALSNRGMP